MNKCRKIDRNVVNKVVAQMENLSGNEVVSVRKAAILAGYSHLNRAYTESVLIRFLKLNDKFYKFQLKDPTRLEATQSLFTTAFVAENAVAGAILVGSYA